MVYRISEVGLYQTGRSKSVVKNARKIDEILFRLTGKHGWRNFITDADELREFDEDVAWAEKIPTH